jgi:hypothetical protein
VTDRIRHPLLDDGEAVAFDQTHVTDRSLPHPSMVSCALRCITFRSPSGATTPPG